MTISLRISIIVFLFCLQRFEATSSSLSDPSAPETGEFKKIDILYFGDVTRRTELDPLGFFNTYIENHPDAAVTRIDPITLFQKGDEIGIDNDETADVFQRLTNWQGNVVVDTGQAIFCFLDDSPIADKFEHYLGDSPFRLKYLRYVKRGTIAPIAGTGRSSVSPAAIASLRIDDPSNEDEWHPRPAYLFHIVKENRPIRLLVIVKTFGGYARLIPLIDREKRLNEELVVVSNGKDLPAKEDSARQILEAYRSRVDILVPTKKSMAAYLDLLTSENRSENGPTILGSNVLKDGQPLFEPFVERTIANMTICFLGLVHDEKKHYDGDYTIVSPFFALEEFEGGANERCQLTVVVSNLPNQDHSALIGRFPWIDLITANTMEDFPPYPKELYAQANPDLRVNTAMVGTISPGKSIGLASFRFRKKGIVSVEMNNRIPIDESEPREAKFDRLDEDTSQLFHGLKKTILPGIPFLFPGRHHLSAEEIANLTGTLLFEAIDCELIFLKHHRPSKFSIGRITADQLRSWLKDDDGLIALSISGGDVKRIKAYLDKKNLENPRYFIGGYTGDQHINGIPINTATYYRVITSSSFLDDLLSVYPEIAPESKFDRFILKGKKLDISPEGHPLTLYEFLSTTLKQLYPSPLFESLEIHRLTERQQLAIADLRHHLLAEINYNRIIYTIEIKSLSINLSSSTTERGNGYDDVRNASVTANDQIATGGLAEGYFQLDFTRYYLRTGGLIDYGRLAIDQPDGKRAINEQRDNILVQSEGFYKWNKYNLLDFSYEIGPLLKVEYDTELKRNETMEHTSLPREKILRFQTGLKSYDGTLIKDLSIGPILDADFTSTKTNVEYGLFAHLDFVKPFSLPKYNIQYNLVLDGRYFFPTQLDSDDDLGFEMILSNQLKIPLIDYLSITPLLNFFLFKGKTGATDHFGSNLTVGLAMSYSRTIKPQFE